MDYKLEMVKKIAGILIIFIALWGFFYQFTIFIWVADFCWWYVPHIFTAAFISGWVADKGFKLGDF